MSTNQRRLPSGYLGQYVSGVDVAPLLRDLLCQCEVEQALRLIAGVAAQPDRGDAFQDYQLAVVARFLLESDGKGGTDKLDQDGLALCCELATSVVASPGAAFGVPVPDSAWSLAHRVAYQQFPDQDAEGYVLRSLVLYRQIAPGLQQAAGFPFERAYSQRYGLALDEAWRIGYALYRWSRAIPGGSIDAQSLTRLSDLKGIGIGRVEGFLKTVTCDFAAYRSLLDGPSGQRPHFEPYNLNPFRKYPVLRMPDNRYLVPIPGFLLRRITHGLYYDLVELDRRGFLALIGRAFEAYVGRLLAGQSGKASGGGQGQWALQDGDAVLLVQCITRPFGALGRATGDRAHLRQDLARQGGVVDCVKRLQELAASSYAGRRVVGLVVALEDFYLANGPFIRGMVNEELAQQGRPAMDDSIQLAHVGGLEALCSLSRNAGVGLCALLAEKAGRPGLAGLELDAFARYMAARLMPGQSVALVPSILKEAASAYLR